MLSYYEPASLACPGIFFFYNRLFLTCPLEVCTFVYTNVAVQRKKIGKKHQWLSTGMEDGIWNIEGKRGGCLF